MATKPAGSSVQTPAELLNVPYLGAAPNAPAPVDTHDGILVGLSNDALVISTAENRQQSFRVAKDAYVCCDGVTCAVESLKIGSKIRLTAQANDKSVATIIESLKDQIDFAEHL